MDESVARAIVDNSIEPMRKALGLNDLTVIVTYEHVPESPAECRMEPGYSLSRISIDPADTEGRDDLLRNLRHELLHTLHWRFEIMRKQVAELVSGKEFNALDVSFRDGAESTVAATERLLDGLGFSPERLIEFGKSVPPGADGSDPCASDAD